MTPSELLKKIRADYGITQDELAHAISVTVTTVNRWENNKSTPNRMARTLLAEFIKRQGADEEMIEAILKIR